VHGGANEASSGLNVALVVTGLKTRSNLRALRVRSLDKVDNLETLKQIVLQLEQAAAKSSAEMLVAGHIVSR